MLVNLPGLALALALTAGPSAPGTGSPAPVPAVDTGFVDVSASARISVPTDRARIVFAVETEGTDAGQAVQANADRMDAVLRALRELDVEGYDVETTGFQLRPLYERPEDGVQRIRGYRALNNVSVTVDDVESVGRIVDAAVDAGANRVTRLSFEASDTEEARREALRQAVEEARAEARVMAEALGMELGTPLEVRGGADRPQPPRPMAEMAMRADAQASTPVEAGDQVVSASVNIRYRLVAPGG
jgi:hypothetical protein